MHHFDARQIGALCPDESLGTRRANASRGCRTPKSASVSRGPGVGYSCSEERWSAPAVSSRRRPSRSAASHVRGRRGSRSGLLLGRRCADLADVRRGGPRRVTRAIARSSERPARGLRCAIERQASRKRARDASAPYAATRRGARRSQRSSCPARPTAEPRPRVQ